MDLDSAVTVSLHLPGTELSAEPQGSDVDSCDATVHLGYFKQCLTSLHHTSMLHGSSGRYWCYATGVALATLYKFGIVISKLKYAAWMVKRLISFNQIVNGKDMPIL